MPYIEKKILPILSNEEKKIYNNLIDSKLDYPAISKDNILEAAESFKSLSYHRK